MGTGTCMTAPNVVYCPYCEISWPHDPPHQCPVKERQEEERLVGLVKHGVGEVLHDDTTTKTAASEEQTAADRQALVEEIEEEDVD